jgi:SAM-dependent methyltransferase
MNEFRELLACPACGGALTADWSCRVCRARFEAPDGIPNLRVAGDPRTDIVRRFYEHAPFPGYPPHDSLQALHSRAERSLFARLVHQGIPGDARIVDIGCGTGQMCLYLARADRVVIGADLTRAALLLGAAAARRFGLARVQFVETDLRQPGLKAGSFDVVYSSGVLHHTANPRTSFARLAQLARPGGTIVIGVYNAFARVPLRLRRFVARLSGFRVIPFDPVLRDRNNEPERRKAGSAISTSIPKSIATRSPKSKAGLPRIASSTCGHTRARSWAMNQGSCSRAQRTTGVPRAGLRSWDGFARSGTKAGSSSLSADARSGIDRIDGLTQSITRSQIRLR